MADGAAFIRPTLLQAPVTTIKFRAGAANQWVSLALNPAYIRGMNDDFEQFEIDENKMLASLKLSMEQSARGEGRPVAEFMGEERIRFLAEFPEYLSGNRRP